jgi:PTH1 family peptidyl-tRNA hydrolase
MVGLGNPGPKYEQTRHNVGFWFVDEVARQCNATLRSEVKFHGDIIKIELKEREVWLLKPTTFMNNSGQAVNAVCRFFKIKPENILVVHDELDLPTGTAKLKKGGGHGGHNGLRSIIAHLDSKEFQRLRIGIDHPGNSRDVVDYVLKKPTTDQRIEMGRAMDNALAVLPDIIMGETQKAMNALHSK